MDIEAIKALLDDEISKCNVRPKVIKFGLSTFLEFEKAGYITRGSGGPFGQIEWNTVPWYSANIFAFCDPSFIGDFDLPPF